MLRLGFWGFKRTREDAHLDVANFLRHLGMGHVLVNNNSFDQFRLFQSTTRLALHLDQVEIHVRVVADGLRDAEDGVDLRTRRVALRRRRRGPLATSRHRRDRVLSDTRSETAQNRKKDHPLHQKMETIHEDGVRDTEIHTAICAIFRL